MGTGRWIDEVSAAYQLPESVPGQSRRLKYLTFRWAVCSMVLVICTAVCGAGTDTGKIPSSVHFGLAAATLAVNFWAYFNEFTSIHGNGRLLGEVMEQVNRIRKERGLD